jgi:biopolymer transport protein ExbD
MTRSRISFSKNPPFEEPTVNLTPLIDVVFVILIMFIIIAPLMELDNVELADGPSQPTQNSHSVKEHSPILIYVAADNTIKFNNQTVNPAQLTDLFKQAKLNFPTANPQIFHDRRAHFGTYQTVKNAAEAAGFSNIEIILKPA